MHNLPGAVCNCSALLDSSSSCEWRPCGHGLRTVSGLHENLGLCAWLCFARGAGKNPAWLKCISAQRCVSLLKAGEHVPLVFPLRCYAWICRIARTNSLRRLLPCASGPIGARSFGPVCPSVHCWTGGGAVTYCCRSLSCDGHSLALCGCLCLLVARNIGLVRVHVCRAKRCVLRTDGHEPFSFLKLGALYALAVPDSFSLRRTLYLRSIVSCVLGLLGSICSCIASLDSVLSSGRRSAVAVCARSLCCAGLALVLWLCFAH